MVEKILSCNVKKLLLLAQEMISWLLSNIYDCHEGGDTTIKQRQFENGEISKKNWINLFDRVVMDKWKVCTCHGTKMMIAQILQAKYLTCRYNSSGKWV